eukprot:TRINITY_DN95918_c0_g1_i1.p1 TRINITY_DN95918_c0_g1~~TRINITY_DN95918_c0_g1_i1.p1  ORF type:complete len:295 (+),score=102.23 TRINITY_DN95918_c0_g1_i1:75-959(+)
MMKQTTTAAIVALAAILVILAVSAAPQHAEASLFGGGDLFGDSMFDPLSFHHHPHYRPQQPQRRHHPYPQRHRQQRQRRQSPCDAFVAADLSRVRFETSHDATVAELVSTPLPRDVTGRQLSVAVDRPGLLTISGTRHPSHQCRQYAWHRLGRQVQPQQLKKQFQIPKWVRIDDVDARLDREHRLRVVIPIAEPVPKGAQQPPESPALDDEQQPWTLEEIAEILNQYADQLTRPERTRSQPTTTTTPSSDANSVNCDDVSACEPEWYHTPYGMRRGESKAHWEPEDDGTLLLDD